MMEDPRPPFELPDDVLALALEGSRRVAADPKRGPTQVTIDETVAMAHLIATLDPAQHDMLSTLYPRID